MFKITAIVSLMLIGSTVWGTFSCDSCGSECVKACGTKHFRACCFNYLRKKRGPERVKFWTPNALEIKMETPYKTKLPVITFETVPDVLAELSKDFEPNPYEDTIENRLNIYDA
ncbi:trissin isoform X2 [Choristoneura fumiferana]|uniref:trissin isoform X2 n=1 Tax=Choristoneura fumiferana TaxID=7141 RepID=UPI003D1539F3